jgi:two-component system sensor histidine kinase BarA
MQRGEMIAEQLAPLVAPAMGTRNTDLLERIATQSLEQPDVRAVSFAGPRPWPTPARPCSTRRPSVTAPNCCTQRQRRHPLSDAGVRPHRNLAGDLIPDESDRLLGWVELELSHNGMLLRGYRSLFASLLLIASA